MPPIGYQSLPFDPARNVSTENVKRFACAIGAIMALGIILAITSSLIRCKVEPHTEHRQLRASTGWQKCHSAYMSYSCDALKDVCRFNRDVYLHVDSTRFGDTCYIKGAEPELFEELAPFDSMLCDDLHSCFTIKEWES